MHNVIWITEDGDVIGCRMCENFIEGNKINTICLACRHEYGAHSDEDVKDMDYRKADLFVRKSVFLAEENNEGD